MPDHPRRPKLGASPNAAAHARLRQAGAHPVLRCRHRLARAMAHSQAWWEGQGSEIARDAAQGFDLAAFVGALGQAARPAGLAARRRSKAGGCGDRAGEDLAIDRVRGVGWPSDSWDSWETVRVPVRFSRKNSQKNLTNCCPPAGCPLLAQSGHSEIPGACPLSGVKRTSTRGATMSENDPLRTWRVRLSANSPR